MTQARRLERVLRTLTTIFLLIAAAAFLWRPSAPDVAIAPAQLDASSGPHSPLAVVDPGVNQSIIKANIFSSTRKAPAVRYNPFTPDADLYAPPIPYSEPADAANLTDEEAVPKLYGTIIGPRGAAALMRLDPAQPEARLYLEGERGGAYRVIKVSVDSVVLSGPRGQVVLKLIRREGPPS
ncbi:MAG: hypothetical protein ACREMQ_09090 [Longimicrobiales bacterium]